jgi:hypothetical protein
VSARPHITFPAQAHTDVPQESVVIRTPVAGITGNLIARVAAYATPNGIVRFLFGPRAHS